jgi:hypothetical protein
VLAQLSQTGLITRRIPAKGFDGASYIISSSPRLRLAQFASPFPFRLEKRGLLRTQSQESSLVARFVQSTPELGTALRQLLQFYQERPVTLIKLTYARANERLKAFAEAFRLRKED